LQVSANTDLCRFPPILIFAGFSQYWSLHVTANLQISAMVFAGLCQYWSFQASANLTVSFLLVSGSAAKSLQYVEVKVCAFIRRRVVGGYLVWQSPSHDPCLIVCTWAQHQATSG
jgi:hypothetical protein